MISISRYGGSRASRGIWQILYRVDHPTDPANSIHRMVVRRLIEFVTGQSQEIKTAPYLSLRLTQIKAIKERVNSIERQAPKYGVRAEGHRNPHSLTSFRN